MHCTGDCTVALFGDEDAIDTEVFQARFARIENHGLEPRLVAHF